MMSKNWFLKCIRRIIIFLVSLFLFLPGFTQTQAKISIGGGISSWQSLYYESIYFDINENTRGWPRFTDIAGAFNTDIQLSKSIANTKWHICSGVGFSVESMKFTGASEYVYYDSLGNYFSIRPYWGENTINHYMVNVPIELSYKILNAFYAGFGLQTDFILNHGNILTDDERRFLYSWKYHFQIPFNKIQFGISYKKSFTNIISKPEKFNYEYYPWALYLNVAYTIK